jgi:heme oxygenase
MARLPFAATLAPRTPLLAADLADLGRAMPTPLAFAEDADEAACWGCLYVVEGSRLGGAMLARQVPETLPARYLGAAHPPGQWRAIRDAIDAAGEGKDAGWRARLVEGALACFALYEAAAAEG